MSGRGAAALLAALLLGAAGCSTCGGPAAFTVREGAARSPAPAPPLEPAVRALHLGDFGDATAQQGAVARAIAAAHRQRPFDLGFDAGDLVYECGPDPRLPGAEACAFSADGNTVAPGYAAPAAPFAVHDGPLASLGATPVYVLLGNHDVATWTRCGGGGPEVARRKACLEVAHAGPQWIMPGRHYAVDRGPARFIVVDSNLVEGDYGGFTLDDEVAFVAAQSEGCRGGRTCFLVGHHPPATAGGHVDDFTPAFTARMQRLLDAGGGRIRAWLAGHDHDLQHLRTPSGLDVLVSGQGSRARPRERFETRVGGALLFGSVAWGFGVLEVAPGAWRYRFESERGEPLYCCAAAGEGACEPTICW
jgi:hypothetical protein